MVKKRISSLIEQLTDSKVDSTAYLKEKIFYFTTLMCAILGFIVLIPSLIAAFQEKQFFIISADSFFYLFFIFFVFFKKIPYKLRAFVTCSLLFVLGSMLLVVLGPASAGFAWLFAFPIFSAIFIDYKVVNLALCLNIIALFAIGIMQHSGVISWKLLPNYMVERWFASAANFILLNYIASVSLSLLLKGFEDAFLKEKEIKKQLEISEKKYRSVFENTGTAILIIEEDGTISNVNAKSEELSGYKRQNVELNKKWFEFVFKEDRKNMNVDFFRKAITNPSGISDYELRVITNDDTLKTVALSMGYLKETNQFIVSLADITPRKKAENDLKISENKYRTLIETIPEGIAIIANQKFIYANGSMENFCSKKVTGENLSSVFSIESDREKLLDYLEKIDKHKFTKPLSLKMLSKNGETIDTEITGALTQYNGENSLMIVVRDVTQQKLAAKNKLYNEKLKGVIEMAGAVCHELNQPMMAVSGYGSLLAREKNTSESINTKIEKIQTQIDRMGNITSKLMNITGYHTREYASGQRIVDIAKSTETKEMEKNF